MRAVVFGYHAIGCLGFDALLRHGFDVRAVVTHPDDPHEVIWWDSLAARARERSVPVLLRSRREEPGLREAIAAYEPEVLFSFYFRHLLPADVLVLAPRGGFNLHGSLLPEFRGRSPVNWAILHGAKETGVTLHRMTPRPDAGEILGQERVPIGPSDTAYTVFRSLEPAAERLLDHVLPEIRSGVAKGSPQDPARASYYGGRTPEDGRIDWSQPARRVYDLVRAVTHPYPGAFTTLRGERMLVWWARPLVGAHGSPGAITGIDEEGVVVAAGRDALRLVTVQLQGRPELPASAFAIAEGLAPGMHLGGEGGVR